MPEKTIAFFPAHPAQLWLMRPIADAIAEVARAIWFIRDKDGMIPLANELGISSVAISQAGKGFLSNGVELLRATLNAVHLTRKHNVNLWFTKYGPGNIAAALSGIKSVSFNDDDVDVVPWIAWTSYPFATFIVAPDLTRMGGFSYKTVRYFGLHELFYLHPNRFAADPCVRARLGLMPTEKFAVIRFSALTAHHDRGIRGIDDAFATEIVGELESSGIVPRITSERPLAPSLEKYRIPLRSSDIHNALAFAELFIGDSQSMTAEASVLGTPSIRVSDFLGKLSYLDELERFGLSFGFRPDQTGEARLKVRQLLAMPDRTQCFVGRAAALLEQKCDPVPIVVRVLREALCN